MSKNRLEAFSDGVLAIVITIMVLEFHIPNGTTFSSLKQITPDFLSYVLSFFYLAIYWNNHHHMLHTCKRVTGPILWGNLHLLFWLSLIPFATAWMGEAHFSKQPTTLYGVILLMAGFAYWLLQGQIIASQGKDSLLKKAIGNDWKGKSSQVIYLAAVLLCQLSPWIALGLYLLVAIMWVIPDTRIERMMHSDS
ncbi:MAG: DUF1211 domain-containing protein [Deltaproteobacteria bacterium]|nr:DUF1211 domain-containing protein [Deltaproteobacteria bacterium]